MIKTFNFDRVANDIIANTYVVGKVREPFIVIDLGNYGDDVIDYCKSHYTKCEGIILTHAHFDHIRGIARFLKAFPKTKVYLHEEDKDLLRSPVKNCSKLIGVPDVSIDVEPVILKDNDVLNFESCTLRVIHTPFHTMGSICLLAEDENALFTGDTLFRGAIGRSDLPTSDESLISSSLTKLCSLNENLVCYPGHGDVTTLKNEFMSNPYLRK